MDGAVSQAVGIRDERRWFAPTRMRQYVCVIECQLEPVAAISSPAILCPFAPKE